MSDKEIISENEKNVSFGADVALFIDHIESLATSLPKVLSTIEQAQVAAIASHQEFLVRHGEKKSDEDKTYYIIPANYVRRNRILRKEAMQLGIAHTAIQRNYIVSLVSQFDSFVSSLIKTMFYLRPELLNTSEKQMTFSQIMEFSDLSNAKEYIIEKEIESVMRESHSYHFKWLEGKLDTPLRKDLKIWTVFIELTERRNLFVHNNGIVSNQYIRICSENNVSLEGVKLGETLKVNMEYFRTAFRCLFELGMKLSQVMWRKLLPEQLAEADSNLLNTSFELIHNEQYDLAQIILDFNEKYIHKHSSEDIKLRLILNRAQTYKWLGKGEQCNQIIKSKDWSASSDLFKLASHVLLDEYNEAAMVMKRIGKESKQINESSYKEWPIFKEFRNQDVFQKAYDEVFGNVIENKDKYASSGFKIIDRQTFHDNLEQCLELIGKRKIEFLGSKFFIETHLAQKGFDIGSSWELYNQLTDEGIIETYKHVDPSGKYLPINAVRKGHK